MSRSNLHAPWRIDYIRSLAKPAGGCFLCEAGNVESAEHERQRLVLWTTQHSIVLMNRYPYTNGHLLIAPRAHKAELDELDPAELSDLSAQTVRALRVLKRAMSPQGFNVGINIGRCAGAGLPGHVHQHVVPRWGGDTNFMHVIGEVEIVPQAVTKLWTELKQIIDTMPQENTAP